MAGGGFLTPDSTSPGLCPFSTTPDGICRAMTRRSGLKPGESSILWVFQTLTFLKTGVKFPLQRAWLSNAHTSIFGCPLVSHITRLLSETLTEEILKLCRSTYMVQYSISHKTMHWVRAEEAGIRLGNRTLSDLSVAQVSPHNFS